jgi:hypothetical protein
LVYTAHDTSSNFQQNDVRFNRLESILRAVLILCKRNYLIDTKLVTAAHHGDKDSP